MYGYAEFIPLSEEEILKRVSQEEIIEMALGYKPVPYRRICNPFKKRDRTPGAWFEWFNGKLWFIDFGDTITHRIVFKFIADYYNVKFNESLKLVNTHFQLGLGENSNMQAPKPVIYHNLSDHYDEKKQRSHIIYKVRPFALKDKQFWWSRYEITKQQLIDDEVVALIWYKVYSSIHNKWIINRPYDVCYAYTQFKSQHTKVYRPFAQKQYKWLSNCDENDIGGYEKLPVVGQNLLVKKSYKDYRVVKNQGINNIIWVQNEGCIPSQEILIDLCERFEKIVIWFDNDNSGVKAAQKWVEIINNIYPNKATALWLPEILLESKIKDPSDLVDKKSAKELKEFIVEKDLYETTINNPSFMDSTSNSPF